MTTLERAEQIARTWIDAWNHPSPADGAALVGPLFQDNGVYDDLRGKKHIGPIENANHVLSSSYAVKNGAMVSDVAEEFGRPGIFTWSMKFEFLNPPARGFSTDWSYLETRGAIRMTALDDLIMHLWWKDRERTLLPRAVPDLTVSIELPHPQPHPLTSTINLQLRLPTTGGAKGEMPNT